MIIDKLYESVKQKGVVCVGLDTDLDYIPKDIKNKNISIKDQIFDFNKQIIEATKFHAACFKLQIAYYESLGIEGLRAYKKTLDYLRKQKILTIADIKRSDISETARMYAKAHFEGDFEADFVTLNPYMGMDSLIAYESYFKSGKKGAFVLIRTSNLGSNDIQCLETKDGKKVYEKFGEKLQKYSKKFIGECGYSSIAGVVGCTHNENLIREKFEDTFFLIPGYGAQGGTKNEVIKYFKNGNGGVVNSSRGILLANKKQEYENLKFDEAAHKEVLRMKNEIQDMF